MKVEYFVNEAFDKGVKGYLENEINPDCLAFNSFLVVVIRVLTLIYGKTDLINPYYLKNKVVLINNLTKYGLEETKVLAFLEDLKKYNEFDKTNQKKLVAKNPYFLKVTKALVDMFAAKKKNGTITYAEEELFLDLIYTSHTKNAYRYSYNYLMCEDPSDIEKYYYTKINDLEETKNIKLDQTINLEALNLMGVTLSELKHMSVSEIEKAQDKAYHYFAVDTSSPNRQEELQNSVDFYKSYGRRVTTGNGYVDILLLMSVIATSLSVILILVFNIF